VTCGFGGVKVAEAGRPLDGSVVVAGFSGAGLVGGFAVTIAVRLNVEEFADVGECVAGFGTLSGDVLARRGTVFGRMRGPAWQGLHYVASALADWFEVRGVRGAGRPRRHAYSRDPMEWGCLSAAWAEEIQVMRRTSRCSLQVCLRYGWKHSR